MKKAWNVIGAAVILASCNNAPQQAGGGGTPLSRSVKEAQPPVFAAKKQLCFLGTSGNLSRDTVSITLDFLGEQVGGTMSDRPYEKDARTGTISGVLQQHDIKAKWVFTQEGMRDSLVLDFRLGNDALLQRPLAYDRLSGLGHTDTTAGYTLKYPVVDCR